MSPRSWHERIRDILDAVAEIKTFTHGVACDALRYDAKTMRAVELDFIIIGEAASHIPEAVRRAHPEVPWHLMQAMRNRLLLIWSRSGQSSLPSPAEGVLRTHPRGIGGARSAQRQAPSTGKKLFSDPNFPIQAWPPTRWRSLPRKSLRSSSQVTTGVAPTGSSSNFSLTDKWYTRWCSSRASHSRRLS